MEYLVTMTTRVPDGTPQRAVSDVRARETARSHKLAAAGHLLRLWRPPLQPGEWRTLGLFAAADDGQLEKVLASMPLRVWRTDEVTPLGPHPNDPGAGRDLQETGAEFLTTFTTAIPQAHPARPWTTTPRRARQNARTSWPGKDTWCGCGCCPARGARWACGEPRTQTRCRRSSNRCRYTHG